MAHFWCQLNPRPFWWLGWRPYPRLKKTTAPHTLLTVIRYRSVTRKCCLPVNRATPTQFIEGLRDDKLKRPPVIISDSVIARPVVGTFAAIDTQHHNWKVKKWKTFLLRNGLLNTWSQIFERKFCWSVNFFLEILRTH